MRRPYQFWRIGRAAMPTPLLTPALPRRLTVLKSLV
jgi:hypothetical protein